MNLEELRRVKDRERATDSLQELPDSFYEEVAAYLRELKERRRERASEVDDPFGSEEIGRLTDEIETAEQVAEAIYERRVGKVVKQASFAAADMGGGDEDHLTTEERDLYGDLVERITSNKHRVLDVIAGEADPTGAPSPTDVDPTPEPGPEPARESGDGSTRGTEAEAEAIAGSDPPEEDDSGTTERVDAADLMGDGAGTAANAAETDAPDAGAGAQDDDRTTVRITRDVGEIFGVDERVYSLEAEDVVSLPAQNADPLVDRDAAERLG